MSDITKKVDNSLNPDFDLSKFELIKILSNNSNRKCSTVLGRFPHLSEENQGIITFEKKAFSEEQLQSNTGYFTSKSLLKLHFFNDIYGNFDCVCDPSINNIKTSIIYPATEKHIQKFSVQEIHIFQETPELYKNITLPYLEREQLSLNWIDNIFEHKKETERIIFEDYSNEVGFILLPDLKWDGITLETLYCVAIIRKKLIKSIRDLTHEHLSLLRNIRDKGIEAINKKLGLNKTKLRIYFHYQPTFFHLHVHFTYLDYEAPGIYCEKSHLLDTVINNIELYPDYYQKATLSLVLKETDSLYEKFQEEKIDNLNKRQKTE